MPTTLLSICSGPTAKNLTDAVAFSILHAANAIGMTVPLSFQVAPYEATTGRPQLARRRTVVIDCVKFEIGAYPMYSFVVLGNLTDRKREISTLVEVIYDLRRREGQMSLDGVEYRNLS